MKTPALLLIALTTVSLLPGCIGGGLVRFNDQHYSAFSIGRKGRVMEDPSGHTPAAHEVLARWGQPDSKRPAPNGEIWHYRTEATEVDLHMTDGRAVEATVMKTGATGGYLGTMPDDSGVGVHSF